MKNLMILAALGLCSTAFAQSLSSSVIASGGGFASTANGSLSSTIGQPIAGDRTSTLLLHQGFQVNLSSSVPITTGIEDEYELKIFPNPTSQHLFIEINEKGKTYTYQLIDISGKKTLDEQPITSPSTELDLSSLSPAIYFLRLRDSQGKSKTLSILKNN
jgi:ABC-type oligopeptide transport system substrate-binding subunit